MLLENEKKQNKEIIRSQALPSQREIELNQINNQLSSKGLKIHEIVSDGSCLYR